MSDILKDLVESIDKAIAALKSNRDVRFSTDAENLLRIRRILEGLDPAEIEALLEDDDEEE
ncbi:MAG: hypothetical protein O7A63_09325 [Acidobacteria bacterium]|nr:hypothetical protein [Acidobacteriota bacterium]